MSIGDSIYEVSIKLSELSTTPGEDHTYEMEFRPVGVNFVKTVCYGSEKGMTKVKVEKLLFTKYNFSAEYPIPCNLQEEFQFRVKDVIWNSYNYPVWNHIEPKSNEDVENNCKTTLKLYRHIYGVQFDIALDCATVEFMFPTYPLPAQILYSRANKTAKSTLLFYKKAIYGSNATVIDNNTFGDKFNAPLAGKVFIGIDEGDLKGNGKIDKIKNMITAPSIQLRAMHQAAVEIPNYSKWAVATNNEMFAQIDQEDSRFWVIEVPRLKDEFDPKFKNKLNAEIPHWLGFLKKRWDDRFLSGGNGLLKMQNPTPKDRLWLTEDQYSTEALRLLKLRSIKIPAKNLLDALIEWFDKFNDLRTYTNSHTGAKSDKIYKIYANCAQIKAGLFERDNFMSTTVIRNAIERDLNIKCQKKSKNYPNYMGDTLVSDQLDGVKYGSRTNYYELDYFYLVEMSTGDKVNTNGEITGFKQEKLKI